MTKRRLDAARPRAADLGSLENNGRPQAHPRGATSATSGWAKLGAAPRMAVPSVVVLVAARRLPQTSRLTRPEYL